ncbi:Hypothetical protein CKL_3653 [Clostridium kluyveri DSM 555]|uniref:Uncharacterized protein n=1 Tax=Clostridium kluyveri (strain ATCC 8527 / DSM 555 / NBRC 12016 / NCIMB 10680 / K1) TaxID=431943 RepID=A5N3E7_CLOK5|nr:Hypothetical protein CKL_3653 [Clostridium kluyveri DSM 555]
MLLQQMNEYIKNSRVIEVPFRAFCTWNHELTVYLTNEMRQNDSVEVLTLKLIIICSILKGDLVKSIKGYT